MDEFYSRFVGKRVRGQSHFLEVIGKEYGERSLSDKSTTERRRESLQVGPCNALAYRVKGIQRAIGRNAGYQAGVTQISQLSAGRSGAGWRGGRVVTNGGGCV
jgi:hypothetical protein